MINRCLLIILLFLVNFSSAQIFTSVGNGVSHLVRCMYSDSLAGKLYIGGNFMFASGIAVNGITSWDGLNYYTLGTGQSNCDSSSGMCDPIFAISKFQNEIFISTWDEIGGVISNGIAKWDGANWTTVGTGLFDNGMGGTVGSFYVDSLNLVVSGVFDSAGYVHAKSLAVWDGNTWSPFLNSQNIVSNDPIRFYPLIKYKNEYYCVTTLEDSLGKYLFFARWNGSQWERLQNAFNCTNCNISSGISKLIIYKDELYVSGTFSTTYNAPGNSIAKWDGLSWHNLGSGFTYGSSMGSVYDMAIYHDELYVVGLFDKVNGVPTGNTLQSGNIAKWDGNNWCTFSYRFDNLIGNISVFQDKIYIGGGFHTIDGDSINYFAMLDNIPLADTCFTIGLDEVDIFSNINIYPNPSSDFITINPNTSKVFDLTYILTNSLGEIIVQSQIQSLDSEIKIDITKLPSGIYFLELCSRDGMLGCKKIIKL